MASVEIVGIPQSTYTRVTRIACEEKGVPYELRLAPPHTPESDAIHPFGKVPGFRHGDVQLCETSAIARYLDAAFPGPPLFPTDPRTAALAEQWVSLVNSHMDRTLIRQYLTAYVFPRTADKSPDRAAIDAVAGDVRSQLALLDKAVADTGYLAGEAFSYADANVLPILAYLVNFPESGEAIASAPHLPAYLARLNERPSVKNTVPPPPPGR
jgi:glutathione S-transferase